MPSSDYNNPVTASHDAQINTDISVRNLTILSLSQSMCEEPNLDQHSRDCNLTTNDEESQCDFWSYNGETHIFPERSARWTKRKSKSLHDAICFCSAVSVSLLTVSLLCWALFSNFGRYEFAFRLPKWSGEKLVAGSDAMHHVSNIAMDNDEAEYLRTFLARILSDKSQSRIARSTDIAISRCRESG